MIPFVLGYVLVFGTVCAVALMADAPLSGGTLYWYEPLDWRNIMLELFLLPVVTSSIALDALSRARPRRWLDCRVRSGGRLLLAGVGSALFAAVCVTVLLVWLEEYVPAWVLLPGGVTLATSAAFALMPRVRPGCCIQCGYDVSDGSGGGRCPECGSLDPL